MSTIKHHTPETVEAWTQSRTARREFLRWLTDPATPVQHRGRAHAIVIGWAPSNPFGITAWLRDLDPDHSVVAILAAALWPEWAATSAEHEAFHRWTGDTALCGGCWL